MIYRTITRNYWISEIKTVFAVLFVFCRRRQERYCVVFHGGQ